MNAKTNDSRLCQRCKVNTPCLLHRNIRENGAEDFVWVCSVCNGLAISSKNVVFIDKQSVLMNLTEYEIESLPIRMNASTARCAKCGSRKCERHHWMPRAFVGSNCDDWPQDYLCKECHDEWHRIVTPQLVK